MNERLQKQIKFIMEIDKIKSIVRKTKIFHKNRYENDAEHCWHICMMALILSEYANEKVDMLKVIKMLLIHDLVEIYAGDTIIYRKSKEDIKAERLAAQRVFSILPEEQKIEYHRLWIEFEERKTIEAKYASAIDRLQPLMQNTVRDGREWRINQVTYDEVINTNKKIAEGSEELWDYIKKEIDICDEYDFSEENAISE